MQGIRRVVMLWAAVWFAAASFAIRAAEPVKVAVIMPLSGAFALVGEEASKQMKAAADLFNAKGGLADGRKFEVTAFDGKANPQESVLALNKAIDGGYRFITSGISSVVHALSDAVVKHNQRNPDKPVLLINFDGRDPALTEAKCNFWHFRVNYHTDTELDFLTDYVSRLDGVRKVYLINQDYAFGQAIQRASRELMTKKRPDIQIVGDDMVPLGKVKDFAPYAAKIRASGADSVITGNWGNDVFLLVKSSHDAGLNVRYFVVVGNVAGTTAGLGVAGVGKVWSLFPWHANVEPNPYEKFNATYMSKYNSVENYDYIPAHRTIGMLAKAIDTAKSDEPLKVAYALEGMTYDGPEGRVWMRREDHQLIAPHYIAQLVKAGQPGAKFDFEGTGLGWKTVAMSKAGETMPAMKCKMTRPDR